MQINGLFGQIRGDQIEQSQADRQKKPDKPFIAPGPQIGKNPFQQAKVVRLAKLIPFDISKITRRHLKDSLTQFHLQSLIPVKPGVMALSGQ